jgi:hypothetical protein
MKAKDMIIDFINYIFLLLLIVFCISYFIVGDRVEAVTDFMKALIPFAYLGIAILIQIKYSRGELYKRKRDDNLEVTLNLTYYDKIKDEIVIFLLPIIVLVTAALTEGIDLTDMVQALLVFLTMYLWHNALFKKTE